jgi:hypothetical protein
MTVIRSFLVCIVAAVACACGADSSGGSGGAPAAAQSRLTVTVRANLQAQPRVWQLQCDPPGGDHPNPASACAALERAPHPFAPVPSGVACAQLVAGPERATIEGRWRGEEVHATYKRTDSCEEDRWQALADVFHP